VGQKIIVLITRNVKEYCEVTVVQVSCISCSIRQVKINVASKGNNASITFVSFFM
jgi:hypothetical protein